MMKKDEEKHDGGWPCVTLATCPASVRLPRFSARGDCLEICWEATGRRRSATDIEWAGATDAAAHPTGTVQPHPQRGTIQS